MPLQLFSRNIRAYAAEQFGKIIYIDELLRDYRQYGTNSVGRRICEASGMLAY